MSNEIPHSYYESAEWRQEDRAEERAEKEAYESKAKSSPKPVRETWEEIFERIIREVILGESSNDTKCSKPQAVRECIPVLVTNANGPMEPQ